MMCNSSDLTRKESQNELLRAIFVSMVTLSQSLEIYLALFLDLILFLRALNFPKGVVLPTRGAPRISDSAHENAA